MQLTDIQQQMLKTFFHLRRGIGWLGIAFPLILSLGGFAVYHLPLADSMSAYYHETLDCRDIHLDVPGQCGAAPQPAPDPRCAVNVLCPAAAPKPQPTGEGPMRDWFVGVLVAIGVGLFLIKGFSVPEDRLLTVAGILAVVVATNPMPWLPGKPTALHVHYIAAVTFFVLIGLVIFFCSAKTLEYMPANTPDRANVIKRYKYTYKVLAILMGLSPFAAIGLFKIAHLNQGIFFAEAAGVMSFGAYWLFKTKELTFSDVEGRAMRGEINMNTSKLQ
jgi:hypothetical protein